MRVVRSAAEAAELLNDERLCALARLARSLYELRDVLLAFWDVWDPHVDEREADNDNEADADGEPGADDEPDLTA